MMPISRAKLRRSSVTTSHLISSRLSFVTLSASQHRAIPSSSPTLWTHFSTDFSFCPPSSRRTSQRPSFSCDRGMTLLPSLPWMGCSMQLNVSLAGVKHQFCWKAVTSLRLWWTYSPGWRSIPTCRSWSRTCSRKTWRFFLLVSQVPKCRTSSSTCWSRRDLIRRSSFVLVSTRLARMALVAPWAPQSPVAWHKVTRVGRPLHTQNRQGLTLADIVKDAVTAASLYTHLGILAAQRIGNGYGPLNHLHSVGRTLIPRFVP